MAITITLLTTRRVPTPEPPATLLIADMALTADSTSFVFLTTFLPPDTIDVQAYLNAHVNELWQLAQTRGTPITAQQVLDYRLDAEALTALNTQWRTVLAPLKNLSPDQIATLVQNRINGWTTLAQAKADLVTWMPVLIAVVAWTTMKNSQRD